MVLPCIEVKRFEISMFSCTWLLQQMVAVLQAADVESENCKFGICALSCAPLRFGLLPYCCRFAQYNGLPVPLLVQASLHITKIDIAYQYHRTVSKPLPQGARYTHGGYQNWSY